MRSGISTPTSAPPHAPIPSSDHLPNTALQPSALRAVLSRFCHDPPTSTRPLRALAPRVPDTPTLAPSLHPQDAADYKNRLPLIKTIKTEGSDWVSKYARGGSARTDSARRMYIAVDAVIGHLASNGWVGKHIVVFIHIGRNRSGTWPLMGGPTRG